MKWNDYFRMLLAICVYREARGEGDEGMRAVANVIANRVKDTKTPDRWEDVILGKNQFTSMTYAGDSQLVVWPKQPDARFESAMKIAESVFNGWESDNTHGARFYANLETATSGWFFEHIVNNPTEHPQTVQIGNHTFFR